MNLTRNQHQGTFVDFLGFDGNTYRAAHVVKINKRVAQIRYRVTLPSSGERRIVTAYVPKTEWHRFTAESA